jgi:protocatechuate 3,4-dioxygenase beta subunit
MRRHITACALLLFLLTAAGSEAGQLQIDPSDMTMQMLPPGQQAKTGTGKLRGRVVAADTGSIVRRAQVRIGSSDIGSKSAFTDAQGRYEFKDLPAGRFNLSVSKSGFVTIQYGQARPFEPGRPIDLADAQIMEKVDVALPRGSAVSGRVLDEFGEPVADASVTAMRTQYTGGRRRLVQSGRNSTSNDLGQFRLFGLPPGEYYVSVTVRTFDTMIMDMMGMSGAGGPVGSNNNSGYAATYYPGTPNPAEAQRLTLAVGQELGSVDIQMQPVRLAKITGSAASSDGKAMSGAMVMLLPTMKDAMTMMSGFGSSRTDKDGKFTLSGVAPGEYSIQIQSLAEMMSQANQAMAMIGAGESATAAPPPQPLEREFAVATVNVAGDDIAGLVVTGARGARASGRLVFEDGPAPKDLTSLRLMAAPTDFDNMASMASAFGMAAVKNNGTFEIDGLVGARAFSFMNPPEGWSVKRVTHEADDVTDKGYVFKPGENVEGFEIVMTTKSQPVAGSVTNDKGEPVKDCTVVVFPEDRQQWAVSNDRTRGSARPDQQGKFKFMSLPPGAYLAIAVEYVAEGEWADPEWLARAAKKATGFTLVEGAPKTLDLKLSGS